MVGYSPGFLRRTVGGFGCQKIKKEARHKLDKPAVPVGALLVGRVVHREVREGGGDLAEGSKSALFAPIKI